MTNDRTADSVRPSAHDRPETEGTSGRVVLAALDDSAAVASVVETALRLADLTGATVEAVHVGDGGSGTSAWWARHRQVPLHHLTGSVELALIGALGDERVLLAVFGARSLAAGPRPVGHTALQVIAHARKPVVVVPPDGPASAVPVIRRLLLPLEGTEDTSRPVLEHLSELLVQEVELLVLHVFTPETVPKALDHPARDLALWEEEFVARNCPGAVRVELRRGIVGPQVAGMCTPAEVDVAVLAWSQDMSHGHASVVREVLASTAVPVLLLPVG